MFKNKIRWLSVFVLIVCATIFLSNDIVIKAATDKTNPTISLKANSTDPTSGNVKITIKATDTSGISVVKWQTGSRNTSYFKSYGKKLTLSASKTATVSVTKNGIYTFYAKDKAGNVKIRTITIKNIDKAIPTLTIHKSTTQATNKNVVLTLAIADNGLGITSVQYLIGKKTEADFEDAGYSVNYNETKVIENQYNNNEYEYTGKITAKSNNYYTVLIEDAAGNRFLKSTYVKNIDKTVPAITLTPSTIKPTNKSVKVNINVTDVGSGVKEVLYLAGAKVLEDFIVSNTDSVTEGIVLPTKIVVDEEGNGYFRVKENGEYSVLVTDNAGNQTLEIVKITNIDTIVPTVSLKYSVMNQVATITYQAKDKSGISSVKYLKGKTTDINNTKWTTSAKDVTAANTFTVKSSGNYSVLVQDLAGNKTIQVIYVEMEFRAVWISYLEFLSHGKYGYTEEDFKSLIDTMFDNVVDMNMNAVVVQVRPFGDAMYKSSYFPWSKYISGTQGVDPGFDPLEYMVEAAHERGLEIHAWLNPYRVTTASTDYSKLAEDNPARVWYEDDNESNDRNVLSFDGSLYYNPASKAVQTLITNGIKEIVRNYDIDGIHFDDYFYPTLGSKYASKFDNIEYNTYVADCNDINKTPLTIANWRRNNINTLLKSVYKSIKNIDSTVQFGISPGGFIDTLLADTGYYCDIKTWLSSSSYIDYICPQIYWTFTNSSYPFDKTLDRWLAMRTSSTVKMYVGIATYKSGSNLSSDWANDDEILMNQVEYGRNTGLVDGFVFFRYDFFYNSITKPGVDKLLEILN